MNQLLTTSEIAPDRFLTRSLRQTPWGMPIARVLARALQAVNPRAAIRAHVHLQEDQLIIQGRIYDLKRYHRLFIIGAGKATALMAEEMDELLARRITKGIVITKEGHTHLTATKQGILILEAGHPLPDERGAQATDQIVQLLMDAQEDDLVIVLISGGGSALLASPEEGLTLAELQELTRELLACGASIHEINTLRKHLERAKGGKLAYWAAPAQVVTLILSDVVGDPLDMIASGPTAPDPTTYQDALDILQRYQIVKKVPAAIWEHLRRGQKGEIPETPKPGDPLFERVQNVIIGNNLKAAQAAFFQAEQEGFHTMLMTTFLQGEARQVGRVLAAIARQIHATAQPLERPACLIFGGETTVTLRGHGLGGRNQELALGAVIDLAGLPNTALVTLASDGGDGPTDAAGAVVTGETFAKAHASNLDPNAFLASNDSYHFFEFLEDLIKTGPTQTNVNDLTFLFMW